MEMQQYIDGKLAKPMGWGAWGYALHRGENTLAHTPGGADCAIRSTDNLRFAYMLLHKGKWADQQLVPADYVEAASHPVSYQKHAPFGLMFEVNADGHVAGAPRDAFVKSGGGGFGIMVVPSLDLVIYKMAGSDQQYNPALTGLPQSYKIRWLPRQLETGCSEPVQRWSDRHGRRRAKSPGNGGRSRREVGLMQGWPAASLV
jgi:CubicO group peptidase (beta-lactamase class C family)